MRKYATAVDQHNAAVRYVRAQMRIQDQETVDARNKVYPCKHRASTIRDEGEHPRQVSGDPTFVHSCTFTAYMTTSSDSCSSCSWPVKKQPDMCARSDQVTAGAGNLCNDTPFIPFSHSLSGG